MTTIHSKVFGELVWNEQHDQWDGEAPFDEEHDAFELHIKAPGRSGTPPSSIQEEAYNAVRPRYAELKELAVEEFLRSVNDPEPIYDHDVLIDLMSPGTVDVGSDGSIRVSFIDDPSMVIGGHSLVASLSPHGGITSHLE